MAHVRICKIPDCKNSATAKGYCRLHYLKHWREIHEQEKLKAESRLDLYVDAICKDHPDDFMDVIREDMNSPDFDSRVEERVADYETDPLSSEPALEEEIERIIRELKVEKGF